MGVVMWDDLVLKAVLVVVMGLGGLMMLASGVLSFLEKWRKYKKNLVEDAGATGEEGTSRRFPKMGSDPFEKLKSVVDNHGVTLDEHKKTLEEYGEEIASHEATFRVMEEQEKGRTALLDERLKRLIADMNEIKDMAHAGMQQSTGANRSLRNGILQDIKDIREALVALAKQVNTFNGAKQD